MEDGPQIETGPPVASHVRSGRPAATERTTFGARLCALRKAARLSQQEVAAQLDIAQSSYATWERQTPAIRPAQLERLAAILGVTVQHFFDGHPAYGPLCRGPLGKAKQAFERVSELPRREQKRILNIVEDLLLVNGNGTD